MSKHRQGASVGEEQGAKAARNMPLKWCRAKGRVPDAKPATYNLKMAQIWTLTRLLNVQDLAVTSEWISHGCRLARV